MTFGNPLFLWSLVLLSVPILIHLFRFRKYKKVYFTRAVLLDKSVADQRKVKNLKHILILFSRLLSLLFLILGFSLPFFNNTDHDVSDIDDARHLILVIDNHLGLHFSDENTTDRFYTVKKQIKSLLDNQNSFSKISLITLTSAPQTFYAIDEVYDAIESLKPSADIGSWSELYSKIDRVIQGGDYKPNIFIFSDFLSKSDELIKFKKKITPVLIPSFDFSTLECIDSLWEYPVSSGFFYLRLRGETSGESPVIYGEKKPLFSAEKQDDLSNVFSFRFPENMKFNYGFIRPKNIFNSTQNFYFVPSAVDKKSILILYNSKKITDLYRSKFFNMQTVKVDHFSFDEIEKVNFSKYNHTILLELDKIDERLNRQLQEFLKRNTRLLLIPSSDADIISINRFLQNYNMKYMALETDIIEAEKIEYQDLLFRDVFVEEYELPNLPFFRKYFSIDIPTGTPILYTISGKVLFGKSIIKNGGILYVSSGSFHPENSNMLLHEIFSPMIYNFLHRDMTITIPYHLCGQDYTFNLSLEVKNHDEPIRIQTPLQDEIIPFQSKKGSDFSVTFGRYFTINGIYSLWYNGTKIRDLAFNLPLKKLKNSYLKANEIARIFDVDLSDIIHLKEDGNISQIQAKNQTQLWMYFIWLSFLFLILELSIIKFFR